MVLNSSPVPAQPPRTSFEQLYEKLSEKDKRRVRNNICNTCGISDKHFYQWLKNPSLISKNDRFFIAETVFGLTVLEVFSDK